MNNSANVARFVGLRAQDRGNHAAVLAPIGNAPDGSIRYEEISFQQLHTQTDHVALAMAAEGIGPGMRVLLMVRPGGDLIRCCFALFKLGAVPVVIDPGMGLRTFLRCVERTQPEAIVGIPLAMWVRAICKMPFASVRLAVRVDKRFAKWYSARAGEGFATYAAARDDLAAILFTSGSTGAPKGVCYTHGQFDSQVDMIRSTFAIEPGEIDLPMLPVFSLFNPALGVTSVIPQMNPGKPARVDPRVIIRAIRQCGVTSSFGSPVLWRRIAQHALASGEQFPSMKRILMAGAPVAPAVFRMLQQVFPQATCYSPYGATECLPVSCIDGATVLQETAAATESGKGTCVGKPVAGVQVRIINTTAGAIADMTGAEVLPAGVIGEIIATGPTVTRSYDKLPEATALAKIAQGDQIWHRMGDAGYLDDTGRIWFCGRIVERVVCAETVYYTDCVEGIMQTLPGVGRCALIGLGTAPQQRPALVIEPDPHGPRLTADQVRAFAAQHPQLPDFTHIFFNKKFPVDVRHNAKIHRLSLARKYAAKLC